MANLWLSPDWQERFRQVGLTDFSSFMKDWGHVLIAHRRGRNQRVDLGEHGTIYLKTDFFTKIKDVLDDVSRLRLLRPASAKEMRAFSALSSLGIRVPQVIAYGHRWVGLRLQGVVATLPLPGTPLDVCIKTQSLADRRPAMLQAGKTIATIHQAGFCWPDILPRHMFFHEGTIGVLDLPRLYRPRHPKRRGLTRMWRRFHPGMLRVGGTQEDSEAVLEGVGEARLQTHLRSLMRPRQYPLPAGSSNSPIASADS